MDKIKNLGQVFTPEDIVSLMFDLSKNKGPILEPSAGDGVFTKKIKSSSNRDIMSIEFDIEHKNNDNIIMDFFDLSTNEKFDTVIGNPPYVSFKNIVESTLDKIKNYDFLNSFDNRTNLFIYFIRKCIEHLNTNGEIIFITPREFIKLTSSIKLNNLLHELGTITHWYEYGDKPIFKGYSPNVVIWRFEKNNFTRKTETFNGVKNFSLNQGQIFFNDFNYKYNMSDLFFIKVGAVSGADKIFTNDLGNKEFVCSYTKKTGKLKKMFYNVRSEILEKNKNILITRKIKNFNEDNWWKWGREYYESESKRIYVNCKTRDENPFFQNDCKCYDGSVLALFPKFDFDLNLVTNLLNSINWDDLGFKVGGRLCFTQKSLQNVGLPNEFESILKEKI